MTGLANQLDDIARKFFDTWHAWRVSQEWTLGPDDAGNRMSPFLVETWDRLTPEAQDWFRQHAALVVHAIGEVVPAELGGDTNATEELLNKALKAFNMNHTKSAKRYVEEALDTLTS